MPSLEEALQVVKGLFADAPLTFVGKHYAVSSLDSFPKPVQRPHPPILVGAASSQMLSIAARHANIIGLQTVSTTRGVLTQDPTVRSARTVSEKIERVRQAADERFEEIELSTVASGMVTDRRPEAAQQFARDRGWSPIAADEVLTMPSVHTDGNVEAHHHGRHEVAIYVVKGRSQIRWGERLEFSTEVGAWRLRLLRTLRPASGAQTRRARGSGFRGGAQ